MYPSISKENILACLDYKTLRIDLGDTMKYQRLNYNQLGTDKFRDLCHAVMREFLGPTYCPFSAGGSDGGRDGEFKGTPRFMSEASGYWVVQFKHHDVENIGIPQARRVFVDEVRNGLEEWKIRSTSMRRPDVLLFITNVLFSGVPKSGTHDTFKALSDKYREVIPNIQVWDQARLSLEVDRHDQIRKVWCPTVEDILVNYLVGNVQPKHSLGKAVITSESISRFIETQASAFYLLERDCIVAITEIGNISTSRITIRKVSLQVKNIGTFIPDHHNNLIIEGVEWGTADPLALESQTLRRIGWYFRTAGTGLRKLLFAAEPRPATLRIDFFPNSSLVIDLSIYSRIQLQAKASGNQVVWLDQDNPIKVLANFANSNWTNINLTKAIPQTSKGVLITVIPVDGVSDTVNCIAKSSIEEKPIESNLSQNAPYLIHLSSGIELLQIRLISTVYPVDIFVKGWLEAAK